MIWSSEYRSVDASLSGGLYRPMRLDGNVSTEDFAQFSDKIGR